MTPQFNQLVINGGGNAGAISDNKELCNIEKLAKSVSQPSKHSTSGPHKAHMWQLKWLPPIGTHVGHTFFATVAHVWATCDRCLAHMWPTCGRQEAPMWQTTGPHVAINRYINGNQEANAWHSTGTEMAHVWQLFWPTTGPHVAINRYINGNQEAHSWQ